MTKFETLKRSSVGGLVADSVLWSIVHDNPYSMAELYNIPELQGVLNSHSDAILDIVRKW